jgi:hypothetical protein
MLWWIIGVWLASGAVMPLLWLLSMASRGVFARDLWAEQRQVTVGSDNAAAPTSAPRSYSIRRLASSLAMRAFRVPGHSPDGIRVTPNRRHVGQYVLSGLTTLGALILLFVSSCSFSDSSVTIRDLPSAAAAAHAGGASGSGGDEAAPVAGLGCSLARRSALCDAGAQ